MEPPLLNCRMAWTLVAAVRLVLAQGSPETAPRLSFEVASIRPAQPGRGGMHGIRPLPGGQRYVASGVPVALMVKLMYRLTDRQVVGGPAWMYDELYDVQAKAARPATVEQLHEMFRNLLADRFGLRFHWEKREMRADVLKIVEGGLKMKRSAEEHPFDVPIQPGGPGKAIGRDVSLAHLCWWLSQMLDTPVLDGTGLNGGYDFALEWAAEPIRGPLAETDPGELFAAVRSQLGLRVESRKRLVRVFVVERIERASEN